MIVRRLLLVVKTGGGKTGVLYGYIILLLHALIRLGLGVDGAV